MERMIVNTQGSTLRKEGERLNVYREGQKIQSEPLGPLQQVVLMGRGVSASTPLLYDLVRRGIDVVYQSQAGRFGFRLVGPVSKHSALRVQQVLTVTDPAQALPLARAVVAGKLYNQARVLRQHRQSLGERGEAAVAVLVGQMRQAARAGSAEALRGHEGSGAAAYFGAWPGLFDARAWHFGGRAYHPPPDPVNALLSFGYTLLLNDLLGAVYRIGLDPDVGFYHALDYGRPSLALDLEEEFRPVLVDRLVLRLVREGAVEPGDFAAAEGRPGVVMTDDARRLFLRCYQEQLEVRIRYQAQEQNLSYRQILDRQAEHLARCFLGREERYTPLLIE
jgi:CRISPR-associated protein Cas1